MQWLLLFFGQVPILAFVISQKFIKQKNAIYIAILLATMECAYNSYIIGSVDPFSLSSLILFFIFGGLSLKTEKLIYFKFQPALLSLFLALTFLIYNLVFETPLFSVILYKYVGIAEIIPIYQRGFFEIYLQTFSKSIPFIFLIHSILTAVAATKFSTWWWFFVRFFVFYILAGLLFLIERLLDVSY